MPVILSCARSLRSPHFEVMYHERDRVGTGCHDTREDDVAFLCCCIQQGLNYQAVLSLRCVNFICLFNLLLELDAWGHFQFQIW